MACYLSHAPPSVEALLYNAVHPNGQGYGHGQRKLLLEAEFGPGELGIQLSDRNTANVSVHVPNPRGNADPCCVTIYTKVNVDARPWNQYADF